MQPILSFSLAVSIHWFAQSFCEARNATITTMLRLLLWYQFWLAEICICHKPRPTGDETRDLQIAPQGRSCFHFFYTSGTPHTRHIYACFELLGRPFRSSLLASFFLPFGVAMKGIHSTQLRCYISFLLFVRFTTCFSSSRGRLLDSHKHRLFCLHIQHATCCLFE